MITYTQPKPRGTITTGTVTFFSADTDRRIIIVVVDERDATTILNRLRLEFTDDTSPSYAQFVQATSAGQFRNSVEA